MSALVIAGCAQGYGSEPEHFIEPPSDPEPPPFTGEACMPGERITCTCANGGQGIQACISSELSPTKGELSECVSCGEPPASGASARVGSMSSAQSASAAQAGRSQVAGRSGGSAGVAGQTGGRGGARSSASAGNGGSSAASAGVSGTASKASTAGTKSATGSSGASSAPAGSGGSGGSSGNGGSRAEAAAGSGGRSSDRTSSQRCECNTGCLLIGVYPCCRSDGSCGCTWVPGAYCD